MRKTALVLACALPLAGCLTEGQQKTLAEACDVLEAAHSVYMVAGKPNDRVDTVYTIAHRGCLNPPTNTAAFVTQVLLAAYTIQQRVD